MIDKKNPFLIPKFEDSSDTQMSHFAYGQEVTETFLVGNVSSLWLGKVISLSKYKFFLLLLVLTFIILFSRLTYLQLIQGDKFQALAEGNRSRLETILPSRGVIFDYLGVPLVSNVPTFTLFLNSGELKTFPEEKEKIISILTDKKILLPEEATILMEKESYLPIPVKENVPYETALSLQLATADLNSLKITVDPQRHYQEDLSLAHLLGYLSRITQEEKDTYLKEGYQLTEKIGYSGLESYYQDLLRGIPGKKQIEVDSLGREKKIIAEQAPIAGNNIFLNIDAGLQAEIVAVLKQKIPNKAGAVVALEPKTGKVRAFVSWPTYDSNAFSEGIGTDQYNSLLNNSLKPLYNRVIAGEYPSGSTIKIVMSAAALEEEIINKNTTILSVGGVYYDKWFFPDWKAGGHGVTNVIKAIAESVNSFFYYLALDNLDGHQGLGLDKMLKYFKLFGLGSKLDIDLNGERSGFLPDPEWKKEVKNEVWYPGDTLHLAIGQGDLLVTPLQVAAFTSVIASNGILYQPELIDKIFDPQTNTFKQIESKIIRQNFLNQETINTVAEGLRSAITSGSGRFLDSLPVLIAGKTGTAQSTPGKPEHAWFTGYLPYENPQLVLTVLVENGGEGSEVAVPIARDVLDWYIKNRLTINP